MWKIFFAIYDDSTKEVPYRSFHRTPISIYRTANMGFVEELSGLGFEPTAVFLEEDIEEIKNGNFSSDAVEAEDLQFLRDFIGKWELAT